MTPWRTTLGSALGDRRMVVAAATLIVAVAIVAALGFASAVLDQTAADVEGQQARLDELLRRRPPPPPAPAGPSDPSGPGAKVFAASSRGAASSSLQEMLSAYASDAGLNVERLTVEPATGDDQDRTVVLRLEGTGTISALQAALFRIETGFPYLFVDELELQRPAGSDGDLLTIAATISAAWRDDKP